MEFRPLSTRALYALELYDLNPVDTSWSAFNYYVHATKCCNNHCNVRTFSCICMPVWKDTIYLHFTSIDILILCDWTLGEQSRSSRGNSVDSKICQQVKRRQVDRCQFKHTCCNSWRPSQLKRLLVRILLFPLLHDCSTSTSSHSQCHSMSLYHIILIQSHNVNPLKHQSQSMYLRTSTRIANAVFACLYMSTKVCNFW